MSFDNTCFTLVRYGERIEIVDVAGGGETRVGGRWARDALSREGGSMEMVRWKELAKLPESWRCWRGIEIERFSRWRADTRRDVGNEGEAWLCPSPKAREGDRTGV